MSACSSGRAWNSVSDRLVLCSVWCLLYSRTAPPARPFQKTTTHPAYERTWGKPRTLNPTKPDGPVS